MEVRDAVVGVDHREVRSGLERRVECRFDLGSLVGRQRIERYEDSTQTVVRVGTGGPQHVAVPREDIGEEDLDGMAEDDRVGDLHHRRLHVQREEHAARLGVGHLFGEERAQRRDAHHRRVDHFAGEQREFGLQDGHVTTGSDVFDPHVGRRVDGHRLLVRREVAGLHRRHVSL